MTITVPYNGCYVGNGSKQTVETFAVQGSPVLKVASNLPGSLDRSAVIENLVIDGGGPLSGATGILLEDVCGCLVRNVTIMNCDVGIRVKASNHNLSYGNRFEHIRMMNVNMGIVFEGTGSNKDFSYTTLDDVRISLAGDPALSNVGIKIGPNANLYNAFIAATVWLYKSTGRALEIMPGGMLKYSLVNLEVESAGTGLYVNFGGTVSGNQNFLLTVMGVSNAIINNGTCNDVTVATA